MEALSFRIDEMRRDDLRPRELVLQREGADDLRADMLQPAIEETERDELPELHRPGHRGDVAAAMSLDLVVRGEQDGAAAQLLLRLHELEAHQAPTLRRLIGRAEA